MLQTDKKNMYCHRFALISLFGRNYEGNVHIGIIWVVSVLSKRGKIYYAISTIFLFGFPESSQNLLSFSFWKLGIERSASSLEQHQCSKLHQNKPFSDNRRLQPSHDLLWGFTIYLVSFFQKCIFLPFIIFLKIENRAISELARARSKR